MCSFDLVIEAELFAAFDAVTEGAEWREVLENPAPLLKQLTEILDADMSFYGPLLRKENGTELLSKLSALLKTKADALAFAGDGSDSCEIRGGVYHLRDDCGLYRMV